MSIFNFNRLAIDVHLSVITFSRQHTHGMLCVFGIHNVLYLCQLMNAFVVYVYNVTSFHAVLHRF